MSLFARPACGISITNVKSACVCLNRSEPSSFFRIAVTGSKTDLKVKGPKGAALLVPPASLRSFAASPFTDQGGLHAAAGGGVPSLETAAGPPLKVTFSGIQGPMGAAAAGRWDRGDEGLGREQRSLNMLDTPFAVAAPPDHDPGVAGQSGAVQLVRPGGPKRSPGLQVAVPGGQEQQQTQQQSVSRPKGSNEEGSSSLNRKDGDKGMQRTAAAARQGGGQLGAASGSSSEDSIGRTEEGHTRQKKMAKSLLQQGHVGLTRPGLAGSRLATSAAADQMREQQYDYYAEPGPVQRLYELAVEVWAGPADGPFRSTKVVSIKSKYLLLNDTGMVIEYKQKGTPDIGDYRYLAYGHGRRFAGPLESTER